MTPGALGLHLFYSLGIDPVSTDDNEIKMDALNLPGFAKTKVL